MKYVVFTGPAATRGGKSELRGNLKAPAESMGYAVQGAMNARTQLLVASQADTVKARKAHEADCRF